MAKTNWDEKFFKSTRGQVLTLLREREHTVEELAQRLEITDNAVRSHLAGLERDGLVFQDGFRRGERKPSFVYRLTEEGERVFPKAYDLVLHRVLQILARHQTSQELEGLLRETGREIVAGTNLPNGDVAFRLNAAVELLNQLGGMAVLKEGKEPGWFIIEGRSCPVGAVAKDFPQVCLMAEALLQEYTGLAVKENCNQQEKARCSFLVASVSSA